MTTILLEEQLNSLKVPQNVLENQKFLVKLLEQNWNVKCGDFMKDLSPLYLRKTDVVSGQCLS